MSNFLKSGDFIGGNQFLNAVADLTPTGQPDALGVLPPTAYGGGLTSGDYLRLTDAEALSLSKTSVGTLYGGWYRRVLLKSGITGGGTTGFRRGTLVFWDLVTILAGTAADPYQVTNVEATDTALIAGVIINASDTSGAPLSGNYVWIQTAGVATVLLRTTIGNGAPAVGDALMWAAAGAGADNATVDDISPAAAVTTQAPVLLDFARYIGNAIDVPVTNTLKRMLLCGLEPLRC